MGEDSTTRSTIAVVTGAARGIGRGIALVLGQTGAARHAGRTLPVAELARDYGFTDVDDTSCLKD